MKKGLRVKYTKDGIGNYDFQIDLKAGPQEALEAVHTELAKHGLEIVEHNSDGDYCAYSIREIKKVPSMEPKKHPLTSLSLDELGKALKMFGEYSFDDKGASEVMDLEKLSAKYRALPAKEAAATLLELYKSTEYKGRGKQLAGNIVVELQEWNELFDCPEIENEIDW